MANFDKAVQFILSNEGGYVDNPHDDGLATNFGISLRFLQSLPVESLRKYGFFGDLTPDDVREINEDRAIAIYRGEFWDIAPFEMITNQDRANYIFDCCVNHGIGTGVKMVQRSTWPLMDENKRLVDDGIMGERTISEINHCAFLLMTLMATRAEFYRGLGKGEFINGWLKRCYRI